MVRRKVDTLMLRKIMNMAGEGVARPEIAKAVGLCVQHVNELIRKHTDAPPESAKGTEVPFFGAPYRAYAVREW